MSTAPTEATQRVRDGTADIAVCFSVAPEKDVNVHYAQRAPIFALVAQDHPLAQQKSVSLADLKPWPLAIYDEGVTVRQLFDICLQP